jgi:hypothetical protein
MLNRIASTPVVFVFALLLLSLIFLMTYQTKASALVNIFPPGTEPYGISYEQHIVNFWQWLLSIPKDESPWEEKNCTNGQLGTNSSVYYLSGNGGGKSERACTVPAGKGLLIPVMVVEISDKEYPGASVDDLASTARSDQDSVNSLYLKIDDREFNYEDLLKYRTHTKAFDVVFPDDGIMGVTAGGPSKVVADGFYIVTEPLTEGNHTVHYKSSLLCLDPGCVEPNFAQDIKYAITAN